MAISEFLDYADRDRNALANAAYNALYSNNPDPLAAAYQGLSGDVHRSWGDVFGIPAGTQQDDWVTWGGKNAARFALDATLDPKNLLFGTGAISKGLGLATEAGPAVVRASRALGISKLAAKAGEAFDASPLFQLFGGRLHGDNAAIEDLIAAAQRSGSMSDLRSEADAARQVALRLMGGEDKLSPLQLATGWEKSLPYAESFSEALTPLANRNRSLAEQINSYMDAMNYTGPRIGFINEAEQKYLPHLWTQAAERKAGTGRLGDMQYATDLSSPSREIMQWGDEFGNPLAIGKASDARTGITSELTSEGPKYFHGSTEVFPSQATLAQKVEAFPGIEWMQDPVAAMYLTGQSRQATVNFLKTVDDLVQAGYVSRTPQEGMRAIKLSGWGNLYAEPAVANRLENLGSGIFRPEGRNWLEDLSQRISTSAFGETLGDINKLWRRNTLAWPGWVAGNIGSNLFSLQQAKVNPFTLVDAVKAIRGSVDEVLPGITGSQFAKEMSDRGLGRAGLAGQALVDEFSQAAQGTGRVRGAANAAEQALIDKGYGTLGSVAGTIGRAAATVGEKWGAYNDWVLKLGSNLEDSFRYAAALDYLKRYPNLATMAPEAQAKILDQAARFGREALVDQTLMTPFEKAISKTVVPFYGWTKGIATRTADLAMTDPAALATTERILNALFTPLDKANKEIADPWIKESAPVKGNWLSQAMSGLGPDASVIMTGRFLPQGNLEQIMGRPLDYAMSSVAPIAKVPYEAIANRNTFKDREMDQLAGGFPANFINPILGRPYELAGNTKFGYEAPAAWDYLLGQTPIGRGANTLSDLGRQFGFWKDPYKGEGSVGEGLAYAASGGKVMPFDSTKYLSKRQNEQSKKIRDVQFLLKLATQKGDEKGQEVYSQALMSLMSSPTGVHLEGG